jgi:hypothetical protein
VRASTIAGSGGSPAASLGALSTASDDADELALDTSIDAAELTARLCAFAAAAGDALGDGQVLRVYAALLRGNQRPYRVELNRLASRFVGRLEDAWQA